MMEKIKRYFKGKNPYLLASGAIVVLSIGLIALILPGEAPAGKDESQEMVVSEEGVQKSLNDVWDSGEVEEPESYTKETGADDLQESISETETSRNEEEVPESEEKVLPSQETEPESTQEPEAMPEPKLEIVPEPEAEQVPVPEPEVIPDAESEQAPMPEPEITPDPEPEQSPEPALVPEPEVTPVPEEHVHSWIFESWYQEPTCSNGGLSCEICGGCGETQITPGTATGKHEYIVEIPGDCSSEEIQVCTECNHRITGVKDPKNHIDVEDGFCYGCGTKTG